MLNQDELNRFFLDYANRENALGAIMLTAPWGAGKSHYINNVLRPFLEKKQKKCTVLSLYSIDSVTDLCKSIFIQAKLGSLIPTSRLKASVSLAANFISRFVTNISGFDLSLDEKEYENFFKTLDLSKRILVLEDVERSGIPISDLLGFVNNMTEIGNAKVILVASEKDLKRLIGDKKNHYESIKEKSICDTVRYYSPELEVITEIVKTFEDKDRRKILSDKNLPMQIHSAINDTDIMTINYRSLQYGLQKYLDLSEKITIKIDDEFIRNVFFSIILYSLRKRNNESIAGSDEEKSTRLGSMKYPLPLFAQKFIDNQYYSEADVKTANDAFVQERKYRNDEMDLAPYVNRILEYYVHWEEEILESLQYIVDNSAKMELVPKQVCIRIFGTLLAIGSAGVECENLEKCKDIIRRRFDCSDDGDFVNLYWDGAFDYDEKTALEWKEFKNYVLNHQNVEKHTFIYNLDSFDKKAKDSLNDRESGLFSDLDVNKLADMILGFNPRELHEFRGIILNYYDAVGYNIAKVSDYPFLIDFRQIISNAINEQSDSIMRLQLGYLLNNLDRVVGTLKELFPNQVKLLSEQSAESDTEDELKG